MVTEKQKPEKQLVLRLRELENMSQNLESEEGSTFMWNVKDGSFMGEGVGLIFFCQSWKRTIKGNDRLRIKATEYNVMFLVTKLCVICTLKVQNDIFCTYSDADIAVIYRKPEVRSPLQSDSYKSLWHFFIIHLDFWYVWFITDANGSVQWIFPPSLLRSIKSHFLVTFHVYRWQSAKRH